MAGRGGGRPGEDLVSQMALLRTATGWERVVVPAFVYAGMTADSARRHHTGRGAEWRGRITQTTR